MWNRRDFLSMAVAGPALAAVNIQKPAPKLATGLTIHFIGGTVFKRLPSGGYLAVQPTGGTPRCPGDMVERHRALVIGPKGLLPMPDNGIVKVSSLVQYLLRRAYADVLRDPAVYCLNQTHIRIGDGGAVNFGAEKVADYSQRILKWTSNVFDDLTRSVPPQLSSRFELRGGEIADGQIALNPPAAVVDWRIDQSNGWKKRLSDVTDFKATTTVLSINGKTVRVQEGAHLVVLGAPIRKAEDLKFEREYDRVSHPTILRTLYKGADCGKMDLVTECTLLTSPVEMTLPHPCEPATAQRNAAALCDECLAPPYTEFCPNYLVP